MTMNARRRHGLQASAGSGFSAGIAHFADKLQGRAEAVRTLTESMTLESIRDGSTLTGAPGQPVDTGALRDSWRIRREGGTSFVESDSPYARVVEYNVRARVAVIGRRGRRLKKKKSVYGRRYVNHGPFSMSLTRAAFPRIVEDARRRAMALLP